MWHWVLLKAIRCEVGSQRLLGTELALFETEHPNVQGSALPFEPLLTGFMYFRAFGISRDCSKRGLLKLHVRRTYAVCFSRTSRLSAEKPWQPRFSVELLSSSG